MGRGFNENKEDMEMELQKVWMRSDLSSKTNVAPEKDSINLQTLGYDW